MGVLKFGIETYLVKFDDSYSDTLSVRQGETARVIRFEVTDLNSQKLDNSSVQLKMNIFIKRTKAGTAVADRQEDGSFLMKIPQGLILESDPNGKYQLFITDKDGGMLAQKAGTFIVDPNYSYEGGGTNLLFDFEEFKKALELQNVYLEQMSDNLDRTIVAKNESELSAKESTESKNESVAIKNELSDIFDSEEARKQAHENRTTTFNGWFDVIENVKTGWKTIFSKWTETFNTWTNKVNEWFGKFAGYETAENTRVSSETQRNHAEDNRVASEKSRNLKERDRISNDAKHTESENLRKQDWNKTKIELEKLISQLNEVDAGKLQLEINRIDNDLKEYIKFAQINSITNSLELFLGKDTTEPTIMIPLPKGFSGKYADLEGKPTVYTQTEANNKFVAKTTGMGLSDNNYDDTAKAKVDAIPSNPKYTDTIVDISGKLDKAGGTLTGQLKAQNNTDYTVAQIRNIATGTTLPDVAGFGNGDIFIVRES